MFSCILSFTFLILQVDVSEETSPPQQRNQEASSEQHVLDNHDYLHITNLAYPRNYPYNYQNIPPVSLSYLSKHESPLSSGPNQASYAATTHPIYWSQIQNENSVQESKIPILFTQVSAINSQDSEKTDVFNIHLLPRATFLNLQKNNASEDEGTFPSDPTFAGSLLRIDENKKLYKMSIATEHERMSKNSLGAIPMLTKQIGIASDENKCKCNYGLQRQIGSTVAYREMPMEEEKTYEKDQEEEDVTLPPRRPGSVKPDLKFKYRSNLSKNRYADYLANRGKRVYNKVLPKHEEIPTRLSRRSSFPQFGHKPSFETLYSMERKLRSLEPRKKIKFLSRNYSQDIKIYYPSIKIRDETNNSIPHILFKDR